MAERSFAREVQDLQLGEGEEFRGEGILAITKALLQSGVGYVGGYQGAPISHLMDVLSDAQRDPGRTRRPFRDVGVSEATAAAMLAASVKYPDPRRGDVEVDRRHQCRLRRALQPGLRRGHRRRAHHHRRGLRRRLLDHAGAQPRLRHEIADLAARSAAPICPRSCKAVETASSCRKRRNTPVMLEVRIRACHVHGSFMRQGQQPAGLHAARGAGESASATPTASCCRRPPMRKRRKRSRSAGRRRSNFIKERQLNEFFGPDDRARSASSCKAACTTRVMRALAAARAGRCVRRDRGAALRPECHLSAGRRTRSRASAPARSAVLMVEEGQPEFIEQALNTVLRRARHPDPDFRQGRAADGRRIYRAGDGRRHRRFLELFGRAAARQSAAAARCLGDARRPEGQGA